MSYNQSMFKRIAKELYRIGNEVREGNEQFDRADIAAALDAIMKLVQQFDGLDFYNQLAAYSIEAAVNAMYYDTPPECDEEQLADLLLKDMGYTNINDNSYDIYLKKWEG